MPAHLSLYLDFLRVAAAIVVFFGHYSQGWLGGGLFWQSQAHGHTAVIVFFVISGYVIAYARDLRETSLRSFAIARATRIYSVALPTLLLSALLLHLGNSINPDHYQELARRGSKHTQTTDFQAFLAGLFFIGESWHLHIRILGNTPYWSLAYEVWFYILFACFVFMQGMRRWLAVALAGLIAGPKILLMLPIWLSGVAAWRWRNHFPATLAGPMALGTGLLVLFIAHIDTLPSTLGPGGSWWPMEFHLTDHLLGILIALHLTAVGALCIQRSGGKTLMKKIIHALAGRSFTLYLLHYPLLVFFAAVIPGDNKALPYQLSLLAVTFVTVGLIAQATERQTHRFR